jgi:hypothetical protein
VQDDTIFLGIILDIFSKSDLEPLGRALGDKVSRKTFDRFKRTHHALFELPWSPRQTPSSIILKFCKLIRTLPPSEKNIWESAKSKSFDIGFDEPKEGHGYWGFVSAEAIQAAAQVGARVAFTLYGSPIEPVKPSKKKQRLRKPK